MDDENTLLAQFFKSFAHPTRIGIVKILREKKKMNFTGLVDSSKFSWGTISDHLKFLTKSGVVKKTARRKNAEVLYFIDEKIMRNFPKKFF
ncbi:ArsR family transcriptional regulator [Patescibacteria group bacterium]|nr:ArsR family transcriptional regulator [Patescibacteria group bacterium]